MPFGSSDQPLTLVTSSRPFNEFTYVHRTNYLALTQFMATRKIILSRFLSRKLICFATLLGLLFIQAPRFTKQHWWSSLHKTTPYNSLVSHPETPSGTHFCIGTLRANNYRVRKKVISRAVFLEGKSRAEVILVQLYFGFFILLGSK